MATSREIQKACDDLLDMREAARKIARDEVMRLYQNLQTERDELKALLERIKIKFILDGDTVDKQIILKEMDRLLNKEILSA